MVWQRLVCSGMGDQLTDGDGQHAAKVLTAETHDFAYGM
jgi:hypothetical protein